VSIQKKLLQVFLKRARRRSSPYFYTTVRPTHTSTTTSQKQQQQQQQQRPTNQPTNQPTSPEYQSKQR
jgi:hypothetical protein